MPRPFDWEDDEQMREDSIGCLMVALGFLVLAAACVILYVIALELP